VLVIMDQVISAKAASFGLRVVCVEAKTYICQPLRDLNFLGV